MKKTINVIIFLCFCATCIEAQTLEEAKALFNNKQYNEALPALQKLVKRGVAAANLPLGETYEALYMFDKANACFNTYRRFQIQKKLPTEAVDRNIAHCRMGENMLQGIEKVMVVDSFVVDKKDFLNAYKLSKESGTLYYVKDYFKNENAPAATVYETERQNRIIYGDKTENGITKLFGRIKTTDGEWSAPTILPDVINSDGYVNYPFLLDDGVTLYFSSNGKNSLGGYDIFITRYDTNSDSYLKPDNIGMPFNSPYNDYMMAIDNYHDLGWFASDRYQPASKVCIYVFIPNTEKKVYDATSMPMSKLLSLARLNAIESTWNDTGKLEAAREEVDKVMSRTTTKKTTNEGSFYFVIDDNHIYREYSDFKSNEAATAFKQFQQDEQSFQQNKLKLNNLRIKYGKADNNEKLSLANTISDLEHSQLQAEKAIEKLEQSIRQLETMKIKE
jgi:hypothetical protein